MVLRSKKSIFYTMLTNISRVLLALVLVLSGFVKAVDPKGTMYKLQEYVFLVFVFVLISKTSPEPNTNSLL